MRFFTFLLFTLLLFTPSLFAMTIMSYNVENLFDTSDDPETSDEQYLPKNHPSKKKCKKQKNLYRQNQCLRSNWDEKQLSLKLKRLAKVIDSSSAETTLDILGLVEVENLAVVSRLNQSLSKPFDKIVVAPSSDARGIRGALLLRSSKDLKWVSNREWKVELPKRRTRSILEVNILWRKKPYCFFVNHWPSQGSSTSSRLAAANTLSDILKGKKARKKDCTVVAMGDFNTLEYEDPDPFQILKEAGLTDLTVKLRKNKKMLGSYFFGPKLAWNYLDRFFISKDQASAVSEQDIRVYTSKLNSGVWEQKRVDNRFYGSRVVGTPKRFKAGGVSDHFPIILKLP